MLASALTDWIQAIGTSVAALFTFAAVAAALWQLRSIKQQTVASARASVSQAYAIVSGQMGTIREHLLEHPELYPYLYDGNELDTPSSAKTKSQLEVLCEDICDFADSLVEQRRATPSADMDWSTWESYFRYLYGASPLLRAYILDNIEYYPDYVFSMFGFVVVRDQASGKVKSMWAATAMEEEEDIRAAFGDVLPDPVVVAGYPWIRTWEINEVRDDEQEPRTLVASVQPAKGESRTASLYLTWQGEADSAETDVLRSWVVGLVTESTWLTAVEVLVVEAGEPRKDGRVDLRRKAKPPSRERFLAPDLPIRH